MMQKTSLLVLLITLGLLRVGSAQFVAFNDHFSGPNTHPNATIWNIYGTTGGGDAPNAGFLKDIVTGSNLPITLTITNISASGGATANSPASGTPAFVTFNDPVNYIDWGSGTVNHAIQIATNAVVGHVFTGLNPLKRYTFKGTAIRGGGYDLRWSIFELASASSFESAHTAGALTAQQYPGAIALNQVAVNTGRNDLGGDMAVWENIDPGADGSFTILSKQYFGPIPAGTAGDSYAYALAALRLEEINPIPTPVAVTVQPQSRTANEFQQVVFTAVATGNPSPSLQWYRVDGSVTNAIPNATNNTYTLAAASPADNGSIFFLRAQNTVSNILYTAYSSSAVLTVTPDLTPPSLLNAVSSIYLTNVTLLFSEAITEATATNLANYQITNLTSGQALTITAATLMPNLSNVVLNTSLQSNGATYVLVVSNIRDRSQAANVIPPSTPFSFIAQASFNVASVGSGTPAASFLNVPGGFDLSGGGNDIGSTSDQFPFLYQTRSGNFDVRVRVAGINLSDIWAKAGLMARALPISANSPFAAAIATPALNGCLFQARTSAGSASISSGAYPINYPYTWLRLERSNTTYRAYASTDGFAWALLGSAVITMSDPVAVGFAVSSHANGTSGTAQFRDFGEAIDAVPATSWSNPFEPLGPSTRRTCIAISEIMYKPASTNAPEFIELYNSNPYFENLSGWRIAGDIDYTFPSNSVMQGGSFLIVARDPNAFKAYYGITTNVVGPYTGTLKTDGTVRLRNEKDAIYLEVNYDNKHPWPAGADETGHSLILARPSYGEADPYAWAASDLPGGSPLAPDRYWMGPLRNVVINEILANSDLLPNYIELYNHSTQPVDLSGCTLSDRAFTNKFVIPTNTVIPARGFKVFYQAELNFALGSSGETVYFKNTDGTRLLDVLRFEPQAENVPFGRSPDGAKDFYPLLSFTPGTNNSAILIHDIVINEIMFEPISENRNDEYIELYNQGTNIVRLDGWKFVDGVDFTFPSNTIIPPNGYIVVAKDVTNLISRYPFILSSTNAVGNFSGNLAGRGERLVLTRPELNISTNASGVVETATLDVLVDEVTYRFGGSWPKWSHEGGSSLELINPRTNHRLAHNWAASAESYKAPWSTIEFVGPQANANGTANYLEIMALNESEFLVDDVELFDSGGTNLLAGDFANFNGGLGGWLNRGTHIRSTWEAGTGVGDTGCLHVRTSARGDTMGNRSLVLLPRTVNSGNVTIRAKVKWLCGWPELYIRLRGNGAEATGRLQLPQYLGTPGQPNSRLSANPAPAIFAVQHFPVVPAANEPVVVTAMAHDFDGLGSLVLNYRLDPDTNYSSVPFVDDGTAGDAVASDGIYSATIPGQAANVMVAFQVVATDTLGAAQTFPLQDPSYKNPFECLVRFGDTILASSFGTYRQWLTAANINDWQNRPALSNEKIYMTFVYGNFRAIYNAGTRWAGSPYHQFTGSPIAVNAHYSIDLPADDPMLGTDNFNKIHAPGNGAFDDNTNIREQTSYWMARQLGAPWNYRRFINMFVNGNRRGGTTALMEDSETPGGDVVESRWPDDPDGSLFKLQPWFEQPDATSQNDGGAQNRSWCTLNRFSITSGTTTTPHLGRYRQNYLARAVNGSVNETYQDVYNLVAAANTPVVGGDYRAWNKAFEALVDTEEWVRIFAVEHAVGNWDSFGNRNAQNMYGYKPQNGKWGLMIWDLNIVLGNSGSDGPAVATTLFQYNTADTQMPNFYINNPTYRRAYWRALKELCNYAMVSANVDAFMDARYNALVANGIGVTAPSSAVKAWIASSRTSILGALALEDSATFALTSSDIVTGTNFVTLSGVAPVEVKYIKINGLAYSSLVWTNVKSWTLTLPVNAATNLFAVDGVDLYGNTNFSRSVSVVNTGLVVNPQGTVVINEIMATQNETNAFVEIFNRSTNFVFDISGWQINGLGNYTFPGGTYLSNQQYLVLAKDSATFAQVYKDAPVFDTFDGNLDLEGETLTLMIPAPGTNQSPIIVDKVRYESARPWASTASGTSLQLMDAAQDNARVANWSVGALWRYYSYTNNASTAPGTLYILPTGSPSPCDFYLDDIRLVFGGNPAVGNNLLKNGDFETGSHTNWGLRAGVSASRVTNSTSHGGNYSLHVVASGAGGLNYAITQPITGYAANSNYALSYWFLPGTNVATLTAQIGDLRVRFTGANTNTTYVPYTPGAANSVVSTLPPFPALWLNEVQPDNLYTRTNRFGQFAPWVELYNGGTAPEDLTGYYLANNYNSNLTQWAFPAGTTLNPGEFKLVWLDADEPASIPEELHANFTIPKSTGSVALVRSALVGSNVTAQIVDYLNYTGVPASLSYGDYPDGQPFTRRILYNVTPQGTNDGTQRLLYINEWVAQNNAMGTNGIPGFSDPADTDNDDWFELYNPGDVDIDLNNWFLTDSTLLPTQYRVPNGYKVPAHGFLLVWADGETGQNETTNVGLHVGFQLSRTGDVIALYDPSTNLVDLINFGLQTVNVSEGRYGDGSTNRVFMANPTPGAPNMSFANSAPALAQIPVQSISLGETNIVDLSSYASDPDIALQLLSYGLSTPPAGAIINPITGLFSWKPSAAGSHTITVWVQDNGLPRLSATNTFTVQVQGGSANTPPVLTDIPNQNAVVGQLLSLTCQASDADQPPQSLTFSLEPGYPSGASINSGTGVFSWTPSSAGNFPVTVRVDDNGVPSLSDTTTFTITVTENTAPRLTILREGSSFRISWPDAGSYRLEQTQSLGATVPANWTTWPGSTTTNAGTISATVPITTNQFFRLINP